MGRFVTDAPQAQGEGVHHGKDRPQAPRPQEEGR
jgi:hypothetical protein